MMNSTRFIRTVRSLIHSLRIIVDHDGPPPDSDRDVRTPARRPWLAGTRPPASRSAATARGARLAWRAATSPTSAASTPRNSIVVASTRLARARPGRSPRTASTSTLGLFTRTQRSAWRSTNSLDRALLDQPTLTDHDEIVGHLRHLRQQVAAHSTVRPCEARCTSTSRIQRMPSGSRPLAGSSSTTVCGSPSSTPASPRRCRMPSE